MAPFVKDLTPLSAAPTVVADKLPGTPFAQAIDQFLAGLKEGADAKNPFVKEIRAAHQCLVQGDDGKDKSKVAAADLKNFVQDLEAQKRAHSHHRVLQRLTPFMENLGKLMGLCEELLQASPFGVSVAFTGARVVLGLAVQASNCFDSIVDGIEEIGISLKCYEKFADAFRKSPDIQELLVSSYKRVIQFWFNVSKILSTSRFKGVIRNLVAPINKEVDEALKGLKRDGERVSISAQATMAQQTEREREATRRAAIIRWMTSDSHVDVRVNLRDQVERHQNGTCQWLLDDQRFNAWCASEENAVLWYHANPGSGKTVLAATVIEHLRRQGQNVVHFFYSFNSPRRKQGISGLRSLALQLFHLAKFVPQTLQDRFDNEMGHNMGGLYDQSTAVATVHDLLKHGCADVCIIVDGLDECFDEAQTLTSFKNLLGMETYGVAKWFFTSRNQPQIRAAMEKCKAREIKAEADLISQDIQAYFSNYITCKRCVTRWSKGEDNFLYARLICETLRGEGLTSEEEIDQALQTYPKDLNGYYMRVLEKLGERSDLEQERARYVQKTPTVMTLIVSRICKKVLLLTEHNRRTFLFLVAAAQSVSLNELLDFLAISTGAKDYDRRRIPFIEAIRDLCSPLVVFDKPGQGDEPGNPLLKLCHKTVEEFFRQSPENLDLRTASLRRYFVTSEQANESIGLDCLTYLQYDRYQKPDIVLSLDPILRKPVPREHAFLAYAATFWAQHLEYVSPTPEIYQAVREFLCSPAFWTCLAVQVRVGRYLFGRYIGCKSSSSYEMGIRGSRTRGDDCFGLPLPRWLDRYSHEGLLLDRSMCYFVDEWREVLMTCADGLQSCLPLRVCEPSCYLGPLEKPKHCRVLHLSKHLPEARSVSGCRLLGVAFAGKILWADLVFQDRTRESRFQYLHIPLFSTRKNTISKEFDDLPTSEDWSDWTLSLTRPSGGTEALEALRVNPETLCLRRVSDSVSEHHQVSPAISEDTIGSRKGKWDMMSLQEVGGDGQVVNRPLLVVHMAWKPHEMSPGRQNLLLSARASDQDDGDSSVSEEEDDDASSDDDSSDDGSETNSTGSPQSTAGSSNGASTTGPASGKNDGPATDCMLLVPSGGKPRWILWSTGHRVWSRVQSATHPTLPLVALTHTARQIEVIDTTQEKRTTKHLPEPPDLQEVPLASVRGM